MEIKYIRLKAYLFFIFCSLSFAAMAQTNKDNTELLQGEWVFEDASIPGTEYRIHLDLDNSYIKLYTEIEVKGDTVFLKDDEETQKMKYEIDGNYLGIEFSSGKAFIAEWVIFEDKLYLEFSGNDIYDASKKVDVLLVYKRK